MNQSVEEQIQIYKEKIKKEKYLCDNGAISRHIYSERCGLYCQEFYQELSKMDTEILKQQLLSHISGYSEKTDWESEDCLWIDSISVVPDSAFVPYVVKILKIQGEKVLYFSALTVLKYLPEEIGEEAVPGICEAISANNPFWTEYVFAEAFEALIFNLNGMAEEFIYKSCSSDVPFIKQWATYYRDNRLMFLPKHLKQ